MATSHPLNDPNMIEHTVALSPEFVGSIGVKQLLETLEMFCARLQQTPTNETINTIQKTLQSWEIITIDNEGKDLWITIPLIIYKAVIKRPLIERIKHLFESGDTWQRGRFTRETIGGIYQTALPLKIQTSSDKKNAILNDELPELLVTLNYMHQFIREIKEKGITDIGIFEKPYGVINRNRLFAWFEDNENNHEWSIKETIDVRNFCHVINNATFV